MILLHLRLPILTALLACLSPLAAGQTYSARIQGPNEMGWDATANYTFEALVDGKPRRIGREVEWSLDGKAVRFLNFKKNPQQAIKSLPNHQGKYQSTTVSLRARVRLQTAAGDQPLTAQKTIIVSEVKAECAKLKKRAEQLDASIGELMRERTGHEIDLMGLRPKNSKNTKALAKVEQELKTNQKALELLAKKQKAADQLKASTDGTLASLAAQERLLRSQMTDIARMLKASERYKRLAPQRRKQDKIDFVKAVLGRDAATPSIKDGPLNDLVAAAQLKVKKQGTAYAAKAFTDLGGLVTLVIPNPGGFTKVKSMSSIVATYLDDSLHGLGLGIDADAMIDSGHFIKGLEGMFEDVQTLNTNNQKLNRLAKELRRKQQAGASESDTRELRNQLHLAVIEAWDQTITAYNDTKSSDHTRHLVASSRAIRAKTQKLQARNQQLSQELAKHQAALEEELKLDQERQLKFAVVKNRIAGVDRKIAELQKLKDRAENEWQRHCGGSPEDLLGLWQLDNEGGYAVADNKWTRGMQLLIHRQGDQIAATIVKSNEAWRKKGVTNGTPVLRNGTLLPYSKHRVRPLISGEYLKLGFEGERSWVFDRGAVRTGHSSDANGELHITIQTFWKYRFRKIGDGSDLGRQPETGPAAD